MSTIVFHRQMAPRPRRIRSATNEVVLIVTALTIIGAAHAIGFFHIEIKIMVFRQPRRHAPGINGAQFHFGRQALERIGRTRLGGELHCFMDREAGGAKVARAM